jgi:hypothetical protein
MNRIYFLNKRHVRKAQIPNIWPYKSVHSAPREFFQDSGLTMVLDPQLINHNYFKCAFYVIINETVEIVEYAPGRQYLRYHVPLAGAYNKYNNGFISIEMSKDIKDMDANARGYYSRVQHEALDLMYDGIREFETYFTKREEQQA